MTFDFTIQTKQDLIDAVETCGFVPLFANSVPGFSIEEHVAEEAWFNNDTEGVWEWKGPVIRLTGGAYGKFFRGKAAFISRAWYPDFANYRRDGYDFDAAYDDGLASFKEKKIYDALAEEGNMLSKELRRRSTFVGQAKSGYDATLTRLQMRGYITTTDFEYALDGKGNPYGWGIARYATPESHFGADFTDKVYAHTPDQSARRILDHLEKLLPQATPAQLRALLG